MKKISSIILGSVLIILLLFVSFSYYLKNLEKEKNKLIVGASLGALTAILNEIAKDKIEIINLSEGFVHAHDVELKPEQIRKISDAKIIFSIGYGIDEWVKKIAKEQNISVFEVSSGVNLLKYNKKRVNPHYWLSLKNGKIIALNITKKLIEIDPQNKDFYLKNLNNFYTKIDELNKIVEEIKKLKNKEIIVTHPSFDYLAQEAGLKIIGYLMTEEGEGIGAKEFLNLALAVKKYNIRTIFVEKGFEDLTVKQFADLYKLKLVILDPMEIASKETSYTLTMKENLEQIYNNLK